MGIIVQVFWRKTCLDSTLSSLLPTFLFRENQKQSLQLPPVPPLPPPPATSNGSIGSSGFGSPPNTLTEPVWDTVKRDLSRIVSNLKLVVFRNLYREDPGKALRDWDLWGPFFFLLFLGLTLSWSASVKKAITLVLAFDIAATSIASIVFTSYVLSTFHYHVLLLKLGTHCSLFEVGKVGEHFNDSIKFIPECVWPGDDIPVYGEAPGHLWKLFSLQFASRISCIKFPRKQFPRPTGDASKFLDVLITTLGSRPVGRSVRTLNLKESFDFSQPPSTWQMVKDDVSLDCTIWTADCKPNPIQAVIGKFSWVLD